MVNGGGGGLYFTSNKHSTIICWRNKTNQEPVVFRTVRQANSHKLNLNCSFVLVSKPEIKSLKLEGETFNWIKAEI